MKKVLLALLSLLFISSTSYAGTANIFENCDATKLKDKIIKLYTLEGAQVENYITNANSFSISKNTVEGIYNYRYIYNFTIVQDNKNSIVSLAMSSALGGYPAAASPTSSEAKELGRIKGKILGYYTYGLGFKEKVYFYTEYNQDGVALVKDVSAGAQRIKGFKLTAVNYDAKAKGLYIGDRIKKVNGIKISKYPKPELAKLFKPTSKNDFIDITYKRRSEFKDVRIVPTFVNADTRL